MSRQPSLTRAFARVALSVVTLSAMPMAAHATPRVCLTDFPADDASACLGGAVSILNSPASRLFALKPIAVATSRALEFALLPGSAVAKNLGIGLPVTSTAFDPARMVLLEPAAKPSQVQSTKGNANGPSKSETVNDGVLTVRMTGDSSQPVVAVGLEGGNGKDLVLNRGTVDVEAKATEAPFTKAITLWGGQSSTSDTTLSATATGISGGNGKDTVSNSGMVKSRATAAVDSVNLELNLVDRSHASARTTIEAAAIGIDGGSGKDKAGLASTGTVEVSAVARSSGFNVEVNAADAGTADSTVTIGAAAIGIAGGSAKDSIDNRGSVTAHADAELKEFGLNASFVDVTISDRNPSNSASTTLTATAVGIDAGTAKDAIAIANSGQLTATSRSFASSTGVALASEGVPGSVEALFVKGQLHDIGITSGSAATGLASGAAKDTITNSGTITARADAGAHQQSVNVGFTVFNWHIPTPGIVIGYAGTRADAIATGADGGTGDDVMLNTGLVDVDAVAHATSTVVSANIAELAIDIGKKLPSFPIGISPVLVVSDSQTVGSATATGIAGGAGDDTVRNLGTVDVFGQARGGSADAAAAIGLKYEGSEKPDSGGTPLSIEAGVTLARAINAGESTVTGVEGGSGRDRLTNEGTITAAADTYGYAVTVNLDVQGTITGNEGDNPAFLGGGAASDTSNLATARSTGVAGGEDEDRIVNTGTVTTTADAETVNVNAIVNVGIRKNAALVGVSLARSNSTATATATGLDGGAGDDRIENANQVSAAATAEATSVAVLLNVEGATRKGLAASATVIDADTRATATAVGLRSGGSDKDKPANTVLSNTGGVVVSADATTTAVNVGVSVSTVKETGLAVGVTLSDTSATASASATGIEGDEAVGRVDNAGSIGLASTAQAVAVGVDVTVEGTATGLAAGAALTRAATTADASAVGIAAGGGDDVVVNAGSIATSGRYVQATATTVGVGVEAAVTTKQGASIGAALTDTRATSSASATGIDGGAGNDEVVNRGEIALLEVGSDTTSVAVSVNGEFSKQGLTAGAALALSDATSTATAAGLAGGAGDDGLVNEGTIRLAGIRSDSNAVSVSLDISGAKDGLVLGAALVDADASSTTIAAGMTGGDGRDRLANAGTIVLDDIKAASDAVGVSVDLKFAKDGLAVGAALVETGVAATSEATGLAGGNGADELVNDGLITISRVRAGSDAVAVSVGLVGSANGLDIAAGLADGSSTALAIAHGFDGGTGDDVAVNRGRVAVNDVSADGDATAVSVALAGANNGVAGGVTLADSSATSRAHVFGIAGGDGHDVLWNDGEITLSRVTADTDSVTADVTLSGVLSSGIAGGAALGRSAALAEVEAVGIAGGAGDDMVMNRGTIAIDTVKAITDATDVAVQLAFANNGLAVGAALVDTSSTARAAAAGLQGGAGDDRLVNSGVISLQNIRADADAISVGASLNATLSAGVAGGLALVDGKGTAEVRASGMAGDEGNDILINQGSVVLGAVPGSRDATVQATANATGVTVSGSFTMAGVAGGAAIANTSANARSIVAGMDGGAGDDILVNQGSVDVKGRAKATSDSISVNFALAIGLGGGAAIADASSTATSAAHGLDGGGGRDEIRNDGTVRAASEAHVEATSIAINGFGLGYTSAKVTTSADSTAVGIRSGGDSGPPVCAPDGSARGAQPCAGDGTPGRAIYSAGEVAAASSAHAEGLSISGTLFGAAFGDMGNTATSRATGIQGGDGAVRIVSDAGLSATSRATIDGLSVTATLIGGAFGDASGTATAEATGVETGSGDDTIENRAALAVDASGSASALVIAPALIGATEATANKTATATARGIVSGDGDDRLVNTGRMEVAAGLPSQRDGTADCAVGGGGACVSASSITFDLVGSGKASAVTTATAAGLGMDGGEGDDTLDNRGVLSVGALARSRAAGTGLSLIGAGSADAGSTASASAAGMRGGDGSDAIANRGGLDVAAAAETYASAFSLSLVGQASAAAHTLTSSRASGIDGGMGDDVIVNTGDALLRVGAVASSAVSGSSWSLAGYAPTTMTLGASAEATGLVGGAGVDRILNEGSVAVGSGAAMSATGGSDAIFGGASAASQVSATAAATGIDGGDGDDALGNRGVLEVGAGASLASHATSFVFAGGAASSEVLSARTYATGVAAGAGNNGVDNAGLVSVVATSLLSSTGGAEAVVGTSSSAATVAARTEAVGVAAGDGADELLNRANAELRVAVDANSSASSDASSGGFTSFDGTSKAKAASELSAVGVDLGGGDNAVSNLGRIDIQASGLASASSKADGNWLANVTSIADAIADATSVSDSTIALGIRTGSGADRVENRGEIRILATPTAQALAEGYGDAIASGYGTGTATASASGLVAIGIDTGAGDNSVVNAGRLEVLAEARGIATAKSDGDGLPSLCCDPDSTAHAAGSTQSALAIGVSAVGGANRVLNEGTIVVRLGVRAEANAAADYGDDFISIDSFAKTDADARGSAGIGVLAAGTRADVLNAREAVIEVQVQPQALSDTYANAVGADGDIKAEAYSKVDGGRAVGILVAGLENRVVNDGRMDVTLDAKAEARAWIDPGWGGEIDLFAEKTSATDIVAIGIDAEGPVTTIGNAGSIDVAATARAVSREGFMPAEAESAAYGVRVTGGAALVRNDGTIRVSATSDTPSQYSFFGGVDARAEAFGIALGDASNQAVNSGLVQVRAEAGGGSRSGLPLFDIGSTAKAMAVGITAGNGGNIIVNRGTVAVEAVVDGHSGSASAFGIRTGSGDDTVANYGTISATRAFNGVTTRGIAIDTGAGNDTVILGDGSVTRGDIVLGSGVDTLLLQGSPVIEGAVIDDGATSPSLSLRGSGAGGVDRAKAPVVTVTQLAPMQRLEVQAGTLSVESGYRFRGDGLFLATVEGDGKQGGLHVRGEARLGGSLRVHRAAGPYLNGTTYDVLRADGGIAPGTAFDQIELPAATRLVAFSTEQSAHSLQVRADVRSYSSVATNRASQAVARQLDRVLPGARGDLRQALGDVQAMTNDAQIGRALSSLSPLAHDQGAVAGLAGAQQFARTIDQRMGALRTAVLVGAGDSTQPVRLALAGGSASGMRGMLEPVAVARARPYGLWMQAFAQRGEQDSTSEITGYGFDLAGMAIGLDHRFADTFSAGVSLGRVHSNVTSDVPTDASDIDSYLLALYGNYTRGQAYLNGTLSAGNTRYDSRRAIVIGSSTTPISSRHDANGIALGVGGGALLRAGDGWIDPFLNFRYTQLKEDAFTESGSGVGLAVEARTTEAFVSELGVRWTQAYPARNNALWAPELGVSWLHDFSGKRVISAAYLDAPDAAFAIEGQPVPRDAALLRVGVTYRAGNGFTSFLRYTAELRSGYVAQGVIGEIRYEF